MNNISTITGTDHQFQRQDTNEQIFYHALKGYGGEQPMYKFLITIKLQPGTRDKILEAAPEVQKRTRAEEGCISYDFFTCTDDPDKLAFIECFTSKEAHELHCDQDYTKRFIAFHERFHESLTFETVNIAE